MMELMRNSLKELVAPNNKLSGSLKSAHAGLIMQRGLAIWDSGENKDCKQDVINRVSQIQPSELYKKAYNRWVQTTSKKENCAFLTAQIVGRLYTSMSGATTLETGLTTQHTYGMPMLAGSSVKGAVAAYAEKIGLSKPICQILFGDNDNAGAVIWHDAWWIPNSGKPFTGEIVTTHHQDYYNGKQITPDEMESPIPNQQIACQGSFYFVVEGVNPAWANFACDLLLQTLQEQGMGSKTASGYGYFERDQKSFDEILKSSVPEDDLAGQLDLLSEQELIDSLSKDRNKFFEKHRLDKDNFDDVNKLIRTIFANPKLVAWIESWTDQNKNQKKALKFINDNKR